MLPNLSALGQTPTGHLQQVFVWLSNREKKGQEPNRDPISAMDWRAWVRVKEEDDEPVPPHGWILKVIDPKTGEVVVEDDYLYEIERLAQHLVNGGNSPISRFEVEEEDKQDCIKAANELRANRKPPEPPLQPQPNADPEPPMPLMVRRREPYLPDTDPEAVAESRWTDEQRAERAAAMAAWARREAEERGLSPEEAAWAAQAEWQRAFWLPPPWANGGGGGWRRVREAAGMDRGEPMPPYWRDSERRAEERAALRQRLYEMGRDRQRD